MLRNPLIRTLSIRAVLTLTCVIGAGALWPSTQAASAQTVRRCTNTGCSGVDRCVYFGSVNCSMTNYSCTNTGC